MSDSEAPSRWATGKRNEYIRIWTYRGWCWVCRSGAHEKPACGYDHPDRESAVREVQDHWKQAHGGATLLVLPEDMEEAE